MAGGNWSWKGTFLVLVALLLVFAGWIFYRLETYPSRTASQIAQGLAELGVLQPKITVRNQVFFEETKSVLELAVVTRETLVERETEHEWLGSKKRIRLRGSYLVHAGFDLTQPFVVTVQDRRIITELPAPRVLSIDPKDVEVLAFENGLWNRISPAELETELRALPVLARQKASEGGLQKEALAAFTTRLREKFSPQYEVEVRIPPPARLD